MEGTETEPKYFDAIRDRFDLTNVTLVPNRGKGLTPKQLIKRLDKEKREVQLTREKNVKTEYWAVFDHDNATRIQLNEAISLAMRKGYSVADSKPCFEIWLLLHFGTRANFKGLEASGDLPACLPAQRHLESVDKSYDKDRKGKYKAASYMERIGVAITNAETLDNTPRSRVLDDIGTRVHHLVKLLLD